jgi:outer membrane protein assembly factor BamD (BamD/ComL family)
MLFDKRLGFRQERPVAHDREWNMLELTPGTQESEDAFLWHEAAYKKCGLTDLSADTKTETRPRPAYEGTPASIG